MSETSETARHEHAGGGALQDHYTGMLETLPNNEARDKAAGYATGWVLIAIETRGWADAADVMQGIARAQSIYRDGRWPDDDVED